MDENGRKPRHNGRFHVTIRLGMVFILAMGNF